MATPEMLQPAVQLVELEQNHHLHRINKLGIKQDVSSIFGKKYKPKIIISPTLAGAASMAGSGASAANPDARPYSCMFCPAAFKTETALVNHVRVHVGAGAVQLGQPVPNGSPAKQIVHSCLYCNRSFKQATNLEIHVRTYHPYGDSSNGQGLNYNQAGLNAAYMMNQAGLALWEYKNQEQQQQQQQEQSQHQEENDGEKPSEGNNQSQNSHANNVPTIKQEKLDSRTLAQQWDKVTRQLTTAYSVERPFTCDYCNKCFKQEAHLKQHVRIHTDDRPYGCPFCGKAFRQKAVLNQHVRLHTGEKPYTCEHCGDKFRQMTTLKLHTRKHLTETVASGAGQSMVGSGYREIVRLMKSSGQSEHEQAANVLAAQIAQMQHHGQAAPSEGPPKPRGVGRPPGSTNRPPMDTLYYLERPYTCSLCNKCFKQEAHLKLHERTHSDYRPFACGYCGKAFRLKAILQQHERLHTGEKPYPCRTCGEAFRQMTTLKLHMRKHEVELALGHVESHTVSEVIEEVVAQDA